MHGYFDGWKSDGCFHYTGEGQLGDQEMRQGNAAILNHQSQGRALRVFEGTGGTVKYIGEFRLNIDAPWYETDAPETGGGPIRKVIVFRLKPVDSKPLVPAPDELSVASGDEAAEIPIEQSDTERVIVDPDRKLYTAERREGRLVEAYRDHLLSIGHSVCRNRIKPEGELKPIYTDLYDRTDNMLVEAKGSVTREAIRMAIGQLADYERFLPDPICAILVPSKPRSDLMRLASHEGIKVIWQVGSGFKST